MVSVGSDGVVWGFGLCLMVVGGLEVVYSVLQKKASAA
jgi:hypothetical protein